MKVKLTLSVNQDILEKAKDISKKRHTTPSAIFEKAILLMDDAQAARINPKIKALQGILKTNVRKIDKNEYYKNYGKREKLPS